KLNLEGRAQARAPKRAYEQQLELLQAVAQAVGSAGLGGDGAARDRPKSGRARAKATKSMPIVLIPTGETDADFIYATGFAVETGLYIRYADGDDVLVASPLEIDRARAQSKAKEGLEDRQADVHASWAALRAQSLRARGRDPRALPPRAHARPQETWTA